LREGESIDTFRDSYKRLQIKDSRWKAIVWVEKGTTDVNDGMEIRGLEEVGAD